MNQSNMGLGRSSHRGNTGPKRKKQREVRRKVSTTSVDVVGLTSRHQMIDRKGHSWERKEADTGWEASNLKKYSEV